jgi:hypothetical protein
MRTGATATVAAATSPFTAASAAMSLGEMLGDDTADCQQPSGLAADGQETARGRRPSKRRRNSLNCDVKSAGHVLAPSTPEQPKSGKRTLAGRRAMQQIGLLEAVL